MDRDIADRVLARIAEGSSMRKACEAEGVVRRTVELWIEKDTELACQYARARESGYKVWADQIIEISDDSSRDVIETEDGPKLNPEFTARSRLRVDSRKWLLSKMLPKTYGDKLDVSADVRTTVIWPVNPPAIEQ